MSRSRQWLAVLVLRGLLVALTSMMLSGISDPAFAVSNACDSLAANPRVFTGTTPPTQTFTIGPAAFVKDEAIGAILTAPIGTSVTIKFGDVSFTLNGTSSLVPRFGEREMPRDGTFTIRITFNNLAAAPPVTTVQITCDDSSVNPDEDEEEEEEEDESSAGPPDAPTTLAAERDSINLNTRTAHDAAYDRMNGGHFCYICMILAASGGSSGGAYQLGPAEPVPPEPQGGDPGPEPFYLSKDPPRAPRRHQNWTAFASAGYADGNVGPTANQTGFDFDSYAGTIGVDRFFGRDVIVGAATTFTRLEGDFQAAAGSNDTDTTTVMAYMGWQINKSQYLNAVVSQGYSSLDQVRRITGAGSAKGSTDAQTTAGSIRVGSDLPLYGFVVGGALGADIVYSEIDGYRERSYGAAAFIIPDQDATSALLSVTGRIARPWFRGWGSFVPYASITYSHELADERDVLTVTTVDTALNAIAILDDPDQEAWSFGGGLYMSLLGGSSAGVSATTSLGDQEFEQTTITLRGRVRFGGP